MFDSTFWLLVAFIIFFIVSFKAIKGLIKNKISVYHGSVLKLIEIAQQKRVHSDETLIKTKEKRAEITKTCEKVRQSSILEVEKLKNLTISQVSEYATFKERYVKEKAEIYVNHKVSQLKLLVIEDAIVLVKQYYKERNKTNISIQGSAIKDLQKWQ